MVVPTLKKINPGWEIKDGILENGKTCNCKDPSLVVRKKFKTSEEWNPSYADPSTVEFMQFKMETEEKVLSNRTVDLSTYLILFLLTMFQIDNVYAKLQNYTGVQVLRVWCEGCDTPPSSGIETLYTLYVIK